MAVAQKTFGALPPGINAGALNDAYVMVWLMLWFQTSGAVFPCGLTQPVAPPDGCGIDQSDLDPFLLGPGGAPNVPPKANPDGDVSTDTGAEICGYVMAIIGGRTMELPVSVHVLLNERRRSSMELPACRPEPCFRSQGSSGQCGQPPKVDPRAQPVMDPLPRRSPSSSLVFAVKAPARPPGFRVPEGKAEPRSR